MGAASRLIGMGKQFGIAAAEVGLTYLAFQQLRLWPIFPIDFKRAAIAGVVVYSGVRAWKAVKRFGYELG